jgi:hypothetical protein
MLLLFLAQAAAAPGVHLPPFDTNRYCSKVADAVGGSYEIEETCRNQEADAFASLQSRRIPARILHYCTQVSEAIGGSYVIMQTCVEQESEAADRLH